MKNYRMSKGTTEHYTDLASLRAAWGMNPVTKKTKDEKKLQTQQENFGNKHKCKGCGQPMSYIHGNVMTCTNPKCKGVESKHIDKEGNEVISYHIPYDLLDDLGAEIANNIFN